MICMLFNNPSEKKLAAPYVYFTLAVGALAACEGQGHRHANRRQNIWDVKKKGSSLPANLRNFRLR